MFTVYNPAAFLTVTMCVTEMHDRARIHIRFQLISRLHNYCTALCYSAFDVDVSFCFFNKIPFLTSLPSNLTLLKKGGRMGNKLFIRFFIRLISVRTSISFDRSLGIFFFER